MWEAAGPYVQAAWDMPAVQIATGIGAGIAMGAASPVVAAAGAFTLAAQMAPVVTKALSGNGGYSEAGVSLAATFLIPIPGAGKAALNVAKKVGSTFRQMEFGFTKSLNQAGSSETAYLYQKLGASGEHLKYGITNNPATRYTAQEMKGGKLKILSTGSRDEMLTLERKLHENLPIGPEENQKFYIEMQKRKGLTPPPYNQ